MVPEPAAACICAAACVILVKKPSLLHCQQCLAPSYHGLEHMYSCYREGAQRSARTQHGHCLGQGPTNDEARLCHPVVTGRINLPHCEKRVATPPTPKCVSRRFVSGVPILERQADSRWGGQPDYEAYKASTPVLVPASPATLLAGFLPPARPAV
jgi:hypothetical protein